VHRDIKPDNLLLTEDDVLKVVDFGVSEMFEKENKEMLTAKSAGSPAFLPPELCVSKHGDISGKAADIWSMGVSLYCLRYGRIPFERPGVLELYESIKSDPLVLDKNHEPEFCDLLEKLLEKDPKKRITMEDIRVCLDACVLVNQSLTIKIGTSLGDEERYRSLAGTVREYRRTCRDA
jgi:[calcium/calmodulin-dependent protein kinase] kinase